MPTHLRVKRDDGGKGGAVGIQKPKKPAAPQYSSGLAPQQVDQLIKTNIIAKRDNHDPVKCLSNLIEGTDAANRRSDESATEGEEDEGRRLRRLHEGDAGLALVVWTLFLVFALNIKSHLSPHKCQCPILIAEAW